MKKNILVLMFLFAFVMSGLMSCDENELKIPEMTPDFTFAVEEVNTLKVNFTNESDNAVSYSWDFGDGSAPSTDESPAHQYVNSNKYTVVLTATDTVGVQKKVSREITLKAPNSNSGFTYSNESNSKVVVFTNTSENADTFTWDFGDDSDVVTEKDPTHEFSGTGTYTVVLTATDSKGIFEATTHSEEIKIEILEADFTYTTSDLVASFVNTSKFADSYSWNFGDGSALSTDESPTHEYTTDGTYKVVLTVTGLGGFTAKDSADVTVSSGVFVPNPGDVYDFFTGESADSNIEWTAQTAITIERGVDFMDEKVGKYTRSGTSGSQYDKISARPLPNDVVWTERTTFSIDVYFPSTNTYSEDKNTGITKQVELRLRKDKLDGSGSDHTTEITLRKDVPTLDEWHTIEFDMSSAAHWSGTPAFDSNATYTTLVIMMGRDGGLFAGEFYLKNFKRL